MKTFKYLIAALALALFSPFAAVAEESYVMVGGISGLESTKYASFQKAYEAIKPLISEKFGLDEEQTASAETFDAFFTDQDGNGNATLTYKISGNVVYNKNGLDNLLTMGRKSSHFGNDRHLINFKFVGVTGRDKDTLTVNSDITLPCETSCENETTGIHFESLTIAGSNQKLCTNQDNFKGIDFSVNDCALKIAIIGKAKVGGSYSITDSTLDGTGCGETYAIHILGSDTEPLAITIKGNTISGFARGINIEQTTAVATIEDNTISVTDSGRSCIQLTLLAKAGIKGNTFVLNGGNAFTLHEKLATLTTPAEINISGNKMTGTGYLIYDDATAEGQTLDASKITLTLEGNTIAKTVDTTQGIKNTTTSKMAEVVETVVEKGVVIAKIGEVEYTSLQDAIDAATEGQTVTLNANIKDNVTIAKNLTLDLNGFTLNGGTVKATPTLTVTANVTVKDSSDGMTGTIKREDTAANSGVSSHYVIDIQGKDASLTFESGNVINDSGTTSGTRQGASLVRVGNDDVKDAMPTLVIKGGTFTQNNFTAIKVDYGTFTLEGGTITCEKDEAVKNWASTTITGGTVTGTVASWVYAASLCSSTLEISGGKIDGNVYSIVYDDKGGAKTATVEITGDAVVTGNIGTYKGKNIKDEMTKVADVSKAVMAVSGGTFDKEVAQEYCATGYMPQYNESDGTYGVADAIEVLDSDGATVNTYHSLTEAFAAATAQSGATVKLLADVTETDPEGKLPDSYIVYNMAGVTFDLNGKTYSHYNFSHVFQGTGGIIKNGKMVCLDDGAYALFIGDEEDKTTNFTVEDVEMTGGINICNATGVVLEDLTVNGTKYYAVWTEEGSSVTIKSGTYTAGKLAVLNGKSDTTMKVEGGEFVANGKSLVYNTGVVPSISGGTFDTEVDEKYCEEGFYPVKNESGVYGVADTAIQILNADGVTVVTYDTLKEASAAATAGQTIKLHKDFANTDYTVKNVIEIKLAKGVTLDGNNKTLSGNIKVTVNAAGDVTIKNVHFKDIHNLQALSASQKSYYKFSDTKVGTLSAVYAKKLAGKLTVSGCVFENCDWEALQITPLEGAVVDLRNNSFLSTESEVVTEQLRYVHVQATGTSVGTPITLTMTDNQLYGAPLDSSCGIYSMSSESTLDLTGNYFEYPNTASITLTDKGEDGKNVDVNRCELIYPARSEATVDEDNLTRVALVEKDDFNATAYDSLAAAISAAEEGQTVKLIADTTEDVNTTKNVTLDLGGKMLTNTSGGKATLTIEKDVTATVKNGSIVGGTSYYTIQNNGTVTFEELTVTAGNTGSSMLDNDGTLIINSGTYTGGMNTLKNEPNATLTIKDGTFETSYGENNAHTGVIYNYGSVEIVDGKFTQKATSPNWAYPHVVMTASVAGSTPSTIIKGGTFTSTLKNWKGTILIHVDKGSAGCTKVSGGTFNMKISDSYCADGFYPVETSEGVYGVADAIQVLNTSSGNIVKTYHSLVEASAAATDGQTIKLLTDFANTDYTDTNVIDIKLAKGVTLDGNDKTLSGNIKVTVNAAGDVTIKNVNFKDIHNAKELSASQKAQYAFPEGKVGTLSAVNAKKLAGKLTVSGCVFENCDWDGMQIVPVEGAELEIRDNIFKDPKGAETVKGQLRHVHVEMYYGTPNQMGTAITLTMTDNQFFGEPVDSSCGIYWMNSGSDLNLSGNYFEYPNTASVTLADKGIDGTLVGVNRCELIYPARRVADVNEDNLSFVAVVVKDIYLVTAYDSLAEAISAAEAGQTVKLIDNTTEDVKITKNITLDLGGKTLTGAATEGKATLTIAEGVTATVKNGTVLGTANKYYTIENFGTATFEDVVATAGNTDASMLDNHGTLTINSGIYTGGLNVVKTEEDSVLNITGGTFTLNFATNGYTGVIFSYGTTTISGGEFIQNASSKFGYPQVVLAGVAEGHESIITVTGGTFKNNCTSSAASIFRGTGKASSANFEVSGGTFNKDFSQNFCSTGFYIVKKDGVYTTADAIQVVAADGVTTTTYHSLKDAFAAATARSGSTVKLLANLTEKDAKNGAIPYVMTGVTFDLNGNTYTHYNYAHTFQGTGGVIKNGKIACAGYEDEPYKKGAYALSIGYQGEYDASKAATTSFTVEDVKVTGGVNISHATGVVLTNLTVKATQDYAVWTEGGASVTINGGTYTAGAKAVFSGYSDASITVEDGTFIANSAALVDTTVQDGKSPVVPSISGGTFDKEVDAKYCAQGYCCEKNEGDAYYSVLLSWDSALDEETLAAFSYSGTYDGDAHSISITKDSDAFDGIEDVVVTYKETEEGDYGAENPAYTHAGTKTVYYRVQAPGYATYKGSATVKIEQKDLAKDMFSLDLDGDGYAIFVGDGTDTAKTPAVVCAEDEPIDSDTDFTVGYANNTKIGYATVTITAKTDGNYKGEVTLTFAIAKRLTKVTFDALGGKIGSETTVELEQLDIKYDKLPADPTREDYTFMGWYFNLADDESKATEGGVCLDLNDHTLYARWDANSNLFKYDVIDGTVTITGFATEPANKIALIIPDMIDGMPVTAIKEKAFLGSQNITSVTLPIFLEQVGYRAFHKASALKELNIPSVRDWNYPYYAGNLTIGELAFAETLLSEVCLPEEVTEVGAKAFNGCQLMEMVTILGAPTVGENVLGNAGIALNESPTIRLNPELEADETSLKNLTKDFGKGNLSVDVRTDAVVESVAPQGISISEGLSADEPVVELPVAIEVLSTWSKEVDADRVCVEYSESLEGLASTPDSLTVEEGLTVTQDGSTLLISVPVNKEATSGFFRVKILK